MVVLTWLFGFFGGLCAVMGIITAAGVIPPLGTEFTPMFWLTLSIILVLANIATITSRGGYE